MLHPPLFSGQFFDRHRDPSYDQVVYGKGPESGYCDTGWSSVTVNYSKLILVPYHKPLDPMMYFYDGQKIDLKTRLDIWIRMDVIPV